MSLIKAVDLVDSYPYPTAPATSLFTLVGESGEPIGYIPKEWATRLAAYSPIVKIDETLVRLQFVGTDVETRTAEVAEWTGAARASGEFRALDGWRNEEYEVHSSAGPYFRVERAFAVLLGVVTYGVHVNGYVPALELASGELELWVAKRLATKQTFPGMLDNTIAGGLGYPHGVFETAVKESGEEAGVAEAYARKHLRLAGVVLYMYMPDGRTGDGIVQPEVEFIFDLPFVGIEPRVNDNEVDGFTRMTAAEALAAIEANRFKPNCAVVVLEFLIRHGIVGPTGSGAPHRVTPGELLEIQSRLHRKFPFPTMQ